MSLIALADSSKYKQMPTYALCSHYIDILRGVYNDEVDVRIDLVFDVLKEREFIEKKAFFIAKKDEMSDLEKEIFETHVLKPNMKVVK